MPKSNTLSRAAQAVLEAAAARDDHLAIPPEHLPAAARRAVVHSMLKAGLLEEVAADDGGSAWRVTDDGERVALRATLAGLSAVDAAGAPAGMVEASEPEIVLSTRLVAEQPGRDFLVTTGNASAQPLAQLARSGLNAAVRTVVMAWDHPDANRPDLLAAIDALRAALTSSEAARKRPSESTPRQPRTDTKRAAVLALLRRPEGATVAQVAETTGWATHTARGFFAGLKKAGIGVDVLERVRQVGSGKEGAKGSYTVYRVAEVG